MISNDKQHIKEMLSIDPFDRMIGANCEADGWLRKLRSVWMIKVQSTKANVLHTALSNR
jgi:hypothetical protein